MRSQPIKMDDEKFKRELLAQKQRAQARAYLEQNGCGPGQFESLVNEKGAAVAMSEKKTTVKKVSGDNTLDLLLLNSAKMAMKTNSRATEQEAKHALLEQQRQFRLTQEPLRDSKAMNQTTATNSIETTLPIDWRAVTDPNTGKTYYWNTLTKETTWTRPTPPSRSASCGGKESSISNASSLPATQSKDLPAGWEEHIHPATQQVYYKHVSGKRLATRPTGDELEQVNKTQPEAIIPLEKRKRTDTESQAKDKQRRFLNIDPLDPTGGMGKYSGGLDSVGKMADSTASGPLWQQRPYPAPGAALKGKEKPSGGVSAGPSLPG